MPNATGTTGTTDGYYILSPFEVATGAVLGLAPDRTPVPPRRPGTLCDVRRALRAILRPALEDPPCTVAFSGGRDSSALLAVACEVARREGMAMPVPVTEVFTGGLPGTDETEWQELVVRHLGLDDWERVETEDEDDLLGPAAQAGLVRHGLRYSATLHSFEPILSAARGHALVTGEGGDGVFAARRMHPWVAAWRRRHRRNLPLLIEMAMAVAPAAIRRRRFARSQANALGLDWLRPAARAALIRRLSAELAAEPLDWRRSFYRDLDRRAYRAAHRNLQVQAGEFGVIRIDPFTDRRFLDAFADAAGRWGFVTRTEAMARLFDDLLPPAVMRRRDKAFFNGAAMHQASRAFAEAWDGTGVDAELVDADALRREWLAPGPSAMTFSLLQQAWLACRGR